MMSMHDTVATPVLSSPRGDDRYPSRFGSEVLISRRLDPVVWGSAEQGPLSQSQLNYYTDHGHLHFDDLLSADDVQACLDELQRLLDDKTIKNAD